MRYSSRIERLEGEASEAWVVHERGVERKLRGEDIYLLSIGDPDFDTPASIRKAAVSALGTGRTHYSPSGGEPALRAAIAERTSKAIGTKVDPAQVIIYPGAQAALFALAQCLFDPGDEVIVPEPTYVTYEGMLGAAGAVMRQIPLRPERAFHLDPEDIARAIGPRTRGVMLNFPHNPTGSVLTREEAEATAELCRRHDLALISDEVYSALDFSGGFVSPASLPGMADRTAIVSSLSKSHAMTGWRCGWSITSGPLARHLEKLVRCMHFGVAQFVQDAGAAAFHHADHEAAELRSAYLGRARVVVDRLNGVGGLRCRMPEAGMYIFADVRGTGLDGKEFASQLLDAAGVAVTPGEGFGPSGAGHVRITLGTSEQRLAEACERIAGFVESMVARAS